MCIDKHAYSVSGAVRHSTGWLLGLQIYTLTQSLSPDSTGGKSLAPALIFTKKFEFKLATVTLLIDNFLMLFFIIDFLQVF